MDVPTPSARTTDTKALIPVLRRFVLCDLLGRHRFTFVGPMDGYNPLQRCTRCFRWWLP